MQVLRRLERLVEEEKSPSDDPDLTFLTSLLQLAVGCRAMLRGRRFSFPAADPELLRSFYPLIMNFMLEVLFRDGSELVDGEISKQTCLTPKAHAWTLGTCYSALPKGSCTKLMNAYFACFIIPPYYSCLQCYNAKTEALIICRCEDADAAVDSFAPV